MSFPIDLPQKSWGSRIVIAILSFLCYYSGNNQTTHWGSMAKFISRKTQQCGIALGGIGTGSVELFPDGEFHQWQIANPARWTTQLWEGDGSDTAG